MKKNNQLSGPTKSAMSRNFEKNSEIYVNVGFEKPIACRMPVRSDGSLTRFAGVLQSMSETPKSWPEILRAAGKSNWDHPGMLTGLRAAMMRFGFVTKSHPGRGRNMKYALTKLGKRYVDEAASYSNALLRKR